MVKSVLSQEASRQESYRHYSTVGKTGTQLILWLDKKLFISAKKSVPTDLQVPPLKIRQHYSKPIFLIP